MLAILVSLLRISHTNDICAVLGHTPKHQNQTELYHLLLICMDEYKHDVWRTIAELRLTGKTHVCMSRTHQYDGREEKNYLLSAIFAALVC